MKDDDDAAQPAPDTFPDVELLNLIPGLAEAATAAAKDPEVRAVVLEAMRVAVRNAALFGTPPPPFTFVKGTA